MQPLSERLRPQNIQDFIGQEHLTKENAIFYQVLKSQVIPSMLFWGPPGVGKTTLAQIIVNHTKLPFYQLSAVSSGVKDLREIFKKAKDNKILLFIDEIHRFSKNQQDSLLQPIEKGEVILIGATTENPSFELITPLLSRCQVFILKHLDDNDMNQILENALRKDEVLKNKKIIIKEKEAIFKYSAGDARKLLNIIELIVSTTSKEKITITNSLVKEKIQQNIASYDKNGELHYDIISAFIKSVRGSNPDASLYWLARMIESGEDVKFIARRLIILASEDIGLANPTALIVANNCFQAVHNIGYPEARIILSQATIYLATSPKSNSAYLAISEAQKLVKQTGDLPVPLHLRNAPTKLMKDLDYGKNYKYAHNFVYNFAKQDYFPDDLKQKTKLYTPQNNKKEKKIKELMEFLEKSKERKKNND